MKPLIGFIIGLLTPLVFIIVGSLAERLPMVIGISAASLAVFATAGLTTFALTRGNAAQPQTHRWTLLAVVAAFAAWAALIFFGESMATFVTQGLPLFVSGSTGAGAGVYLARHHPRSPTGMATS